MSVSLPEYDQLNRNPGNFIGFDSSRASSAFVNQSVAYLIGQRTSAGTAAAGTDNFVTEGFDQAKLLFGEGSQLADMVDFYQRNNRNLEIHAIPLDDNGVAAAKTITVTGPATEAGVLNIFIGGGFTRLVRAIIGNGDSADTIALAIRDAINGNTNLLMSAATVTNVVTLTAKNEGEWTENIPIQINPDTPEESGGTDKDPAGTSFDIASTVTGTGNPDLSIAIAAIPDDVINWLVQPYTDNTNMTLWDTELDRRMDTMVQVEGHGFNGRFGTVGTLSTYGDGRNNQFNTTMDSGVGDFTVEHAWAAAYAGRGSRIASNDPVPPWFGNEQGKLVAIRGDLKDNRRSFDDRNILLRKGVATHEVDKDGTVFISAEITNFQKNNLGQPSIDFLFSQTPITLSFIRQSFLQRMSNAFGQGYKLADDGANLIGGDKIATPSIIRAEIVSWATTLRDANIIEDLDQFESELVVERDVGDVNRVNVVLPPNLVNQLRIIAGKITFIL